MNLHINILYSFYALSVLSIVSCNNNNSQTTAVVRFICIVVNSNLLSLRILRILFYSNWTWKQKNDKFKWYLKWAKEEVCASKLYLWKEYEMEIEKVLWHGLKLKGNLSEINYRELMHKLLSSGKLWKTFTFLKKIYLNNNKNF